MNVGRMIQRNRGQKYTVTRVNADGSYSPTTGLFVPGSTTTLQILASVQPMSAQEIASIPEGDREKERLRFYSADPLLLLNNSNLRKGDRVLVGASSFEVESVNHWPNHTKAIIAKVNV